MSIYFQVSKCTALLDGKIAISELELFNYKTVHCIKCKSKENGMTKGHLHSVKKYYILFKEEEEFK